MDNYILTGPNGSQFNVGSYVLPDPGPDFGAKDLLAAEYTETPLAEGGELAAESIGVRRMTFPMRLASSGAFAGGLPGVEAFLASLARPGAHVDLMPQGTATADAVRFDVLGGRYEEAHSIPLQRVARREGELHLEVEPYGYSPSTLTLASVASIGLPGRLEINGASVLGDVPALARLAVQPSSPTSYPLGTWAPDMVAWSLGARPSAVPFWPAASLASAITGALVGDAFAPGSQAVALYPSPTLGKWAPFLTAAIPSALDPAYRGAFRAFAWAQLSPSQPLPFTLSLDAVPAANPNAALASAQAVATLAPIVRGASIAAASPAYHLLDLGDIVLPPVASGVQQSQLLRLWGNPAGTSIGVATPIVKIGGLYLLPVDGDHGVLSRGLGVPTFVAPSAGRFVADAQNGRSFVGGAPTDLALDTPLTPAPHYRGALPRLTPSVVALDLIGGARRTDLAMNYRDEVLADGPIAYWPMDDPAPTYMSALVGPTGAYAGAASIVPGALLGSDKGAFLNTGKAMASGLAFPASYFTVEFWCKRASAIATYQIPFSKGGIVLVYFLGNTPYVRLGGVDYMAAPSYPLPDTTWHHYALTFGAAGSYNNVVSLYRDTVGLYGVPSASNNATGLLTLGEYGGSQYFFPGGIDEVAIYDRALSQARISAHYAAGISPSAGATTPLIRASESFAAVSLTYRPRFRFLKSF